MKLLPSILIAAAIAVSACVIPGAAQTGALQVKVTDQAENTTSLLLTITEIRAQMGDGPAGEIGLPNRTTTGEETNETVTGAGWKTVFSGSKQIDLIAVKDVKEILGEAQLDAGVYTQVRIAVSSGTITRNGETKNLTIPSKTIKFVHPFSIVANKTTSLILDFDADKSIVFAGQMTVFKPVVKVITEFAAKEKGEAAKIQGDQAAEAAQKRAARAPSGR